MKLVKDLRRQGFEVERTGSGHWKVRRSEGSESVIMSFSPSGGGKHPSLMKRLKAIGYQP